MDCKKAEIIRSEDPARDRILRAATKLFYSKGYSNTGINEILEEAGAFKKSLYIHFPSKRELGKAYLLEQEDVILGTVKDIMKRKNEYGKFIRSWLNVLRRGLRNSYIYGCPYANLSNQTHDEPEISEFVNKALERWVSEFEVCLSEIYWSPGKKILKTQTKELAESILFYYQGALQLYGMSGNIRYIDRLEKELLSLENKF